MKQVMIDSLVLAAALFIGLALGLLFDTAEAAQCPAPKPTPSPISVRAELGAQTRTLKGN